MSLKISSADYSDMTNQVTNYSVSPLDTTSPANFGETTYIVDWTKWHGYYRQIPELQSIIDKKALWTIGKGFKADEKVSAVLKKIKGNGKDTFNTILYNMVRTMTICGDAYAEIIRDKAGRLINLKPLSSYTMQIVVDEMGIIKRYEQIDRGKNIKIKFDVSEIFHLCWNRIGDEIHGISTIEKVERIILMRNESLEDLKLLFHRYVKPLLISHVDTDDPTEIAAYKLKMDKSVALGENMIIPKNTAELEVLNALQSSSLNPLVWQDKLQRYFIIAEGVPEIILGWGEGTTEASSKILYLAFQQMIEWNQLFLEEQIKSQLNIDLTFEFPASIEPSLMGDEKKDSGQTKEMNVNPKKDG